MPAESVASPPARRASLACASWRAKEQSPPAIAWSPFSPATFSRILEFCWTTTRMRRDRWPTLPLRSTIPVARGLGASAAALVAGAFLARESLGLDLTREDIATICAEDEGHPDNAGPAVFGGAVLGINSDDGTGRAYSFSPLRIHPDIALVFVVTELVFATADARGVMPRLLPILSAVGGGSNAAD